MSTRRNKRSLMKKVAIFLVVLMITSLFPTPVTAWWGEGGITLEQIKTTFPHHDIVAVDDTTLEGILSYPKSPGRPHIALRSAAEIAVINQFLGDPRRGAHLLDALNTLSDATLDAIKAIYKPKPDLKMIPDLLDIFRDIVGVGDRVLELRMISAAREISAATTYSSLTGYIKGTNILEWQAQYLLSQRWGITGEAEKIRVLQLARAMVFVIENSAEIREFRSSVENIIRDRIAAYERYQDNIFHYIRAEAVEGRINKVRLTNRGQYPIYNVRLIVDGFLFFDTASETLRQLDSGDSAIIIFPSRVRRTDINRIELTVLGVDTREPFKVAQPSLFGREVPPPVVAPPPLPVVELRPPPFAEIPPFPPREWQLLSPPRIAPAPAVAPPAPRVFNVSASIFDGEIMMGAGLQWSAAFIQSGSVSGTFTQTILEGGGGYYGLDISGFYDRTGTIPGENLPFFVGDEAFRFLYSGSVNGKPLYGIGGIGGGNIVHDPADPRLVHPDRLWRGWDIGWIEDGAKKYWYFGRLSGSYTHPIFNNTQFPVNTSGTFTADVTGLFWDGSRPFWEQVIKITPTLPPGFVSPIPVIPITGVAIRTFDISASGTLTLNSALTTAVGSMPITASGWGREQTPGSGLWDVNLAGSWTATTPITNIEGISGGINYSTTIGTSGSLNVDGMVKAIDSTTAIVGADITGSGMIAPNTVVEGGMVGKMTGSTSGTFEGKAIGGFNPPPAP